MKHILVAGASGRLGQCVVQELLQRKYQVRTLSRKPFPKDYFGFVVVDEAIGDIVKADSLRSACDTIDVVISCAGASMDVKNISDRSTFTEVDYEGNKNLLNEAKAAGVKKFIYVSVAGAKVFHNSEYCSAHLQFEQELSASGMEYTIIQPTGFYYFLGEILMMAKKGRGFVIGGGESRTNPVHEQDVAEACVDAIDQIKTEIFVGGPEVFSRKEIVELAFAAAGRTASIISVPPWLFSFLMAPLKLVNPRIHALLEFGARVSTTDVVVAHYGKRRLKEYFQSLQ